MTAKDRENGELRALVNHVLVQVHVIEGDQGQGQGRDPDQDPQEGHGLTTERGPDQDLVLEIISIERVSRSIQEDQGHTHPDQGRVHGQGPDHDQGQGHVRGRQGHRQALFQGSLNHCEFISASSNDVKLPSYLCCNYEFES